MLAMIEDSWWPRIYRGVEDQARLWKQCLQSGRNLKCMLRQKQRRKISEANHGNEIALAFAGPFRNAERGKKYMVVSIDHFSG